MEPKDKSLSKTNEGDPEDCSLYTGAEKQACGKRNLQQTNREPPEIPANPGDVGQLETAFG